MGQGTWIVGMQGEMGRILTVEGAGGGVTGIGTGIVLYSYHFGGGQGGRRGRGMEGGGVGGGFGRAVKAVG